MHQPHFSHFICVYLLLWRHFFAFPLRSLRLCGEPILIGLLPHRKQNHRKFGPSKVRLWQTGVNFRR